MGKTRSVTKAERDAVESHLRDPQAVTQADVIRRLKLNSHNDFYRLVYRVVRDNN